MPMMNGENPERNRVGGMIWRRLFSRRYLLQPEFHILVTSLTPSACQERLRTSIGDARIVPPWQEDARRFEGRVTAKGFRVKLRTRRFGRKGPRFESRAIGRFTGLDEGTRMEVEIGLGRSQALQVWLGGVLFIIFAALFAFSVVWSALTNGAWWVLIPIGVAVFLLARTSRQEWPEVEGRPIARRDRLLEALETTLEAHLSD